MREQDHVPDGRGIGQEHDQPIDPHPLTCRGRQAMLERPNIVGIVLAGFIVAIGLGFKL